MQYTIRSLRDILATYSSFKELSSSARKDYFLDKCNWLITRIANQNYSVDESLGGYVNIHSQVFKDFLGRTYKEIQNALKECSLIEINDVYSEGSFSKSFRLTKRAINLGVVEADFLSTRFENHFSNVLERKYSEAKNNPLFKKLLSNTVQLEYLFEPIEYVMYLDETARDNKSNKSRKQQFNRYTEYYFALQKLKGIKEPKGLLQLPIWFLPSQSQYGRVYHLVASIPRIHRKCMVHNSGEDLYEVDMASAQPSLLMLEWIRASIKSGANTEVAIKNEIAKNLNLVLTGGLYGYIQDNSEYCNDLEYQKLKRDILTTLNADYKPTQLTNELTELFPNFMNWIRATKNEKGNAEISHIGQSAEARIFVHTYKNLPDDVFSLIIHDSIVCLKSDTKLVQERLCKRTKNRYSDLISSTETLKELFNVSKVTMNSEESEGYKILKKILEKRHAKYDKHEKRLNEIEKYLQELENNLN